MTLGERVLTSIITHNIFTHSCTRKLTHSKHPLFGVLGLRLQDPWLTGGCLVQAVVWR